MQIDIESVPLVFLNRTKSQRNFSNWFLADKNGYVLSGPFRLSDEILRIIYADAMLLLKSGLTETGTVTTSRTEGAIHTDTTVYHNNCLFGSSLGVLMRTSILTGSGKDGEFTVFIKHVDHQRTLGGLYHFGEQECAAVFGEPDHHQN